MAAAAGQSLFAAAAFSGASYLFKLLDGDKSKEEFERHNRATEALQKSKQKFYENEVRKHDRIAELQREIDRAEDDINATNKALDLLSKVRTVIVDGRTFDREPRLSDFYKPSRELKNLEYVFVSGLGIASGYAVYKFWG